MYALTISMTLCTIFAIYSKHNQKKTHKISRQKLSTSFIQTNSLTFTPFEIRSLFVVADGGFFFASIYLFFLFCFLSISHCPNHSLVYILCECAICLLFICGINLFTWFIRDVVFISLVSTSSKLIHFNTFGFYCIHL